MSYPPPPGFNQASSLPPRPPPASTDSSKPAYSAVPSYASSSASSGYGGNRSGSGFNSITAFQPRAVAASQGYRTGSPAVSAPPATTGGFSTPTASYGNYYQQPQPSYPAGPSYYGQAQYNDTSYGPSIPQIQNPFGNGGSSGRNDFDPETEAQIAQWQSAYVNKDDTATAGRVAARREGALGTHTPSGGRSTPTSSRRENAPKTVVRSGGGQEWTDSSLLEWDPAHFRLFIGNIAGEVTDDSLFKAFSKYSSVQKARVIRDKRTQKSKGYGFVSFSDGDDYFRAAREMQGKYIGSHPVLLRRATTEVRPASANAKPGKRNGVGGGAGGGKGGGKVKHDGIKKQAKTKGGLKILG